MARKSRQRKERPRIGKQPPRFRFFLNPYLDLRFTSGPQCGNKTRQRKLPLVIHVDPGQLISLNKTCRYCPYCDLLIAHKDQIDDFLAAFLGQQNPKMVGNDYFVIGTQDRTDWLRGMHTPLPPQQAFEYLHDFKDYVTFEPAPRWVWTPPTPSGVEPTGARRNQRAARKDR